MSIPSRTAIETGSAPRRRALSALRIWLPVGLSITLLVVFVGAELLVTLRASAFFNGFALNGAFQLYNPLRRMAEGQVPGADFPFFHGVGVPWLYLPFFTLLGGNLFASEVVRGMMSPLLFLGSSLLFFRVALGRWRTAVIAGAVLVAASPVLFDYSEMVQHGNALLGVRSTTPVLVAALLLMTPRRTWIWRGLEIDLPRLGALALLGLSVSMGTEHGVAACVAYCLVRLAIATRRQGVLRGGFQAVFEGVVIIVLLVAWQAVFTRGDVIAGLKYALVEIPQDQSWFFGVPPNSYLNWAYFVDYTLRPLPLTIIVVSIATVAAVILLARRGRLPERATLVYVFMLGTGLISCVSITGYYNPSSQFSPLGRIAALVAFALVALVLFRRDGAGVTRPVAIVRGVVGTAAAVSLAIGLWASVAPTREFSIRETLTASARSVGQPDSVVASGMWGGELAQFAPYLDGASSLWTNWAGMHESVHGLFNPSSDGEDYIIHALGEERRAQYQRDFVEMAPEYAMTVNPRYSAYEGWIWAPTAEMYAHLITHYDLVEEGPMHFLWQLRDEPIDTVGPWQQAEARDAAWTLERSSTVDEATELLEVTVEYDASANLPLMDRLPRYFLDVDDSGLIVPISVSANTDSMTFLVPLMPGQTVAEISARTDGFVPPATLEVTDVRYRTVDFPEANAAMFIANYCYPGTPASLTLDICAVD